MPCSAPPFREECDATLCSLRVVDHTPRAVPLRDAGRRSAGWRRWTARHGTAVRRHGAASGRHGAAVDASGQATDASGQTADACGSTPDAAGKTTNADGQTTDAAASGIAARRHVASKRHLAAQPGRDQSAVAPFRRHDEASSLTRPAARRSERATGARIDAAAVSLAPDDASWPDRRQTRRQPRRAADDQAVVSDAQPPQPARQWRQCSRTRKRSTPHHLARKVAGRDHR